MEIEVGQIIPISAQLYDGRTDVEVTATVKDDLGLLIGSTKLFSIGEGAYISNDVRMPNVRYVVVQYFTNMPDDYPTASETFLAIPKAAPKENILIGEVVSKVKSDNTIRGVAVRENT